MKKIYLLICFLLLGESTSIVAQCTSFPSTYDIIVADSVVIPPSGPSFTWSYICGGGVLMDSAMCCTRLIHVEAGGTYEAGPSAYGFVYLKSGATFDAHGNNSFANVAYEAGATILNYTGAMSLCSSVTFPNAGCSIPTSIAENPMNYTVQIYPNPFTNSAILQFNNPKKESCILILYDLHGRIVRTISNITTDKVEIERQNLPSGFYFVQLSTNKQTIANGKLTME